MPAELPENVLANAAAAVTFAQQIRRYHRRRTNRTDERRERDLDLAVQRVREAMAPLRSEIGRFPYGPQTSIAEENRRRIRATSEALQRERRKLWKMQKRKEPDA